MGAEFGDYIGVALGTVIVLHIFVRIPPYSVLYRRLRFRYQWIIFLLWYAWAVFSGALGEAGAKTTGGTYNHDDTSFVDQLISVVIITSYSIYKFLTYETNNSSIWRRDAKDENQSE